MKKALLLLLCLLSALLLFLAWPVFGYSCFIFIAFVPLFFIEENVSASHQKSSGLKILGYSYLSFLIWNLLTTWWIYNASGGGAAMAILANSLLMALVFTTFHSVKKRTNTGYFSLICFWLAFEYLHLNWDLSWPWLTLGNVFSLNYRWVQWYEYTGALGGSLWVVCANILAFKLVKALVNKSESKLRYKSGILFLVVIALPILASYAIYAFRAPMHPGAGTKVILVQPNIDPYNEKFSGMSDEAQLMKLLHLAESKMDTSTAYLIAPETALPSTIWENKMTEAPVILELQKFLKNHPNLKIVIGASTAKAYLNGEQPSATARKFMNDETYFDSYNTALQLDSTTSIQLYHKSKLVPGVEKIPFPALFKPFEKFAIDLGGTSGSLGVQDTRTVFYSSNKSVGIAPVICYESIYGEFVGDYVRNGAQLIFIITNDGWWGDTPGYKQHMSYASLRAIETRREIARSANTGTSAIVNSRGDVSLQTEYWKEAVVAATVYPSTELTFYVQHGDYLGWLAALLSGLILLFTLYLKFSKAEKV